MNLSEVIRIFESFVDLFYLQGYLMTGADPGWGDCDVISLAPLSTDPSLGVPQYALDLEDLRAMARSEKEDIKRSMGKAYCLLVR